MEKAYKLEFGGQPGGELFMTCCGCSRTEPLHCFGPAMKPHYLIHYVLNGRGIFKMEGEEYPLEAGCGFLIEPGQMLGSTHETGEGQLAGRLILRKGPGREGFVNDVKTM